MSSKEENLVSNGPASLREEDEGNPEIDDDVQPSEREESDEGATTAIDKGPYGDVAILTIDGDFLRSLGYNPDRVDEVRYRPYNGAVLVEPVNS